MDLNFPKKYSRLSLGTSNPNSLEYGKRGNSVSPFFTKSNILAESRFKERRIPMKEFQFGGKMDSFITGFLIRRNYIFGRHNRVPDLLLTRVLELHQQGIQGDKDAVKEAFDLLETIRRFYPAHQLVKAYYGSILTLLGRDAVDPIERLEKVRLGLKFLDDAVQTEPDNIEIRITRGYVCSRLPEVFFHRTATGVADFTYIITRYEQDPKIISNSFYKQLLKDLAQAYQTLGREQDAQSIHQKLNRAEL
jgi:hypothetical protein